MNLPRRAFLVLADPPQLDLLQAAAKDPKRIPTLASQLAAIALPHQRAAAVSERVIGDVRKRPQARDNQRFGFAAGNLPYLLAAEEPAQLAAAIQTVHTAQTEAELESFFSAQAEKLGVHVRSLDRGTYAVPNESALAVHFASELELLAAAAERRLFRAPSFHTEAAEIAGRILGRTGPAFGEGRDRSLAALASDEAPSAAWDQQIVDPLELPGEAVRAHFGPVDPTSPIARELRAILAPAFGGERNRIAAPPLRALLADRWPELQDHARRCFLSDELADWRLLVGTAAAVAEARCCDLLEVDRVFRWGYRWPPL